MACSYYVYYRVDPAQARAGEPVIGELFAAIRQATGVAGRLLRKRGEPLLWMEVFENVGDEAQFERTLAETASRLQLQTFLQAGTGRHTECSRNNAAVILCA